MATKTEGMNIYQLIGVGMRMIGAIGKDSKNQQQGFMYRGIDAVYNALNPVLSELGIFITPEVLEQKREERVNAKGTVLIYTILTMRYTVYAPDGSNVSLTVVGEGMDTGDKSTNKAMSVAMKYAMFQLFCIPTEEMKDPDADVYTDVLPRSQKPQVPQTAQKPAPQPRQLPAPAKGEVTITQQQAVPQAQPDATKKTLTEAQTYLNNEIAFMAQRLGVDAKQAKAMFAKYRKSLIDMKAIPDVQSSEMTRGQAEALMKAIYANFIDNPEGKRTA